MGLCASSDRGDPQEKARDRQIEKDLHEQFKQDRQILKLLLLGAGESGKSTVFKQMIQLYGKGYKREDKMPFVPMIRSNVVESMRTLCDQANTLGHEVLAQDEAKLVLGATEDNSNQLTPTVAAAVLKLWQDPGIKKAYEDRAKFQLVDNCPYFFEKAMTLARDDYEPSVDDVVKCRVRTTGIVEEMFEIENNKFLIVDVGGQRNERKKWIHCFDSVTAVIYVVAASAYDLKLFEDGVTNRLDESVNLFQETTSLQWFAETSFIVFLNKTDLLAEKIAKRPFKDSFPDFAGDNSVESACAYLQARYADAWMDRGNKRGLYFHLTCATDSQNVQAVFAASKDIILNSALAESGLL